MNDWYGEYAEDAGHMGEAAAEREWFPHEPKKPPKFALIVNGEEVDLADLVTPMSERSAEERQQWLEVLATMWRQDLQRFSDGLRLGLGGAKP